MTRTQTAHYCCFNLQCWVNLATLAAACGHDLWSFEGPDGRGMARAFDWLLPHMAMEEWPYEQIEPFDRSRFLPLFFSAQDYALGNRAWGPHTIGALACDPLYSPHNGVKPFWMLGRKSAPATLSASRQALRETVTALLPLVADWIDGDG